MAGRAGEQRTFRLTIREEPDVAVARQRARELAQAEGLSAGAAAAVAIAVSEIARNIVVHAGAGEITLSAAVQHGRRGVRVVARDRHPGIADVELAMKDGYSTAGGLGLGLPSARRLMDEFQVVSALGEGTTVTMAKWANGAQG